MHFFFAKYTFHYRRYRENVQLENKDNVNEKKGKNKAVSFLSTKQHRSKSSTEFGYDVKKANNGKMRVSCFFPILNCRYMCGALPLPLKTLFPSRLFAFSFCFISIGRALSHTRTRTHIHTHTKSHIVHSKKRARG